MLCSIAIIKNGDKNLFDGRTQFNLKSEILSLDFRVDLKYSYIILQVLPRKIKEKENTSFQLKGCECFFATDLLQFAEWRKF